jgi:DNA-binding MarR family transcriptional regulator
VRDPRTTEARALLSDLVRAVNLTLPQVEAPFARELGVGIVELDMLAVLKAAPGGRLAMGQLGKNLTISTASVTRIAGRLETSGYLQRVNSTDDRRVVFAVITPTGRSLLKRARPVAGPALDEAIGRHYTLDEIHELRSLLARLLPDTDAG